MSATDQTEVAKTGKEKLFADRPYFDNASGMGQESVAMACRECFFLQAWREYPSTLDKLKQTVLPAYAKLHDSLPESARGEIADVLLDRSSLLARIGVEPPEFLRWPKRSRTYADHLLSAIAAWSKEYNLAASYDAANAEWDWVSSCIFFNLDIWHTIGKDEPWWTFVHKTQQKFFGGGEFSKVSITIDLELTSRDPLAETEKTLWKAFREQKVWEASREQIKSQFRGWITRRNEAARADGLKSTRMSTLPLDNEALNLAKYQIGGMSYRELAEADTGLVEADLEVQSRAHLKTGQKPNTKAYHAARAGLKRLKSAEVRILKSNNALAERMGLAPRSQLDRARAKADRQAAAASA